MGCVKSSVSVRLLIFASLKKHGGLCECVEWSKIDLVDRSELLENMIFLQEKLTCFIAIICRILSPKQKN